MGTAFELATPAIAADADDAMVIAAAGFVLVMVGRAYDTGLHAIRHGLELNPGSGFVAMLSSTGLLMAGHPDESLTQAERAMALSPMDPGAFMFLAIAALANLGLGRAKKALELATRSAALYPDWDSTYWALVPANILLERPAEARTALAKFVALSPGVTISSLRTRLPIKDPDFLAMILEGFRKAGLPE